MTGSRLQAMRDDEYPRLHAVENGHWWYRATRALLAREVARQVARRTGSGPARLLDAGCGTGGNLSGVLAPAGFGVGIDLAKSAAGFAGGRAPGRVARGSVLELPFAADTFDVVTSVDVIYHAWVVDPPAAVAELVRVLKPGGALILQTAALERFRGGHDRVVMTGRRYDRPQLAGLLSGAGLTVERLTYRNTWFAPLALARRASTRHEHPMFIDGAGSEATGDARSDLDVPSGWLNRPMEWMTRMENALLSFVDLPIGLSLFAVARKPGEVART